MLLVVVFTALPIRSSILPYNPWFDTDDNGRMSMDEINGALDRFGSTGTPLEKAALLYDSGWLNITDKCGQDITVTHNLNITDWNDPKIAVDITGKTTLASQLLRFLGLTGPQGWNRTYGRARTDEAWSLVQTSDGGYAITGFGVPSYDRPTDRDFWLVKTDAYGNMQWNQTYGGIGLDSAYDIVQTGDSGYALAGLTDSFGAGLDDFWLIKTDSSGTQTWNRTYGGSGGEQAYSVCQTSDGGYALVGFTDSIGAGYYDVWLVKTDASGNMQWNQTYGGTDLDWACDIVQTGDGGYALVGDTYSFGSGGDDFWLVRTDANGNELWNKTYGGTGGEEAWSVVQTRDGGYAMAGLTGSFGAGDFDFWLVKTDASGNMQWNQTYGGIGYDWAYDMVQTSDGGYAMAGFTYSFGAGGADFLLVRTDANGNELWNRTYGGGSEDRASSLVQTSDGGYALAGGTWSFGAGNYDFWLVKTDANGNIGGSGLIWVGFTSDTIKLYRGAGDPRWNYVRVQIWKHR